MKIWIAWPRSTAFRSSGWAFWRAPMPTKWAFPVPLGQLYGAEAWKRLGNVRIHFRARVERIDETGFMVAGERRDGRYYICALPFERLEAVGLAAPKFEHSPITGVHLWFDREVTNLPHATLLDRTMQWMFNKDSGRYLQLVVSASRDLTNLSPQRRSSISPSAICASISARARRATVKAHVIKEQRATFSAAPETECLRPAPRRSRAWSWRAIGPAPAGPPPWKARYAAATSPQSMQPQLWVEKPHF